jgi:hypothetical protein
MRAIAITSINSTAWLGDLLVPLGSFACVPIIDDVIGACACSNFSSSTGWSASVL